MCLAEEVGSPSELSQWWENNESRLSEPGILEICPRVSRDRRLLTQLQGVEMELSSFSGSMFSLPVHPCSEVPLKETPDRNPSGSLCNWVVSVLREHTDGGDRLKEHSQMLEMSMVWTQDRNWSPSGALSRVWKEEGLPGAVWKSRAESPRGCAVSGPFNESRSWVPELPLTHWATIDEPLDPRWTSVLIFTKIKCWYPPHYLKSCWDKNARQTCIDSS
jgi:hypothetical protein